MLNAYVCPNVIASWTFLTSTVQPSLKGKARDKLQVDVAYPTRFTDHYCSIPLRCLTIFVKRSSSMRYARTANSDFNRKTGLKIDVLALLYPDVFVSSPSIRMKKANMITYIHYGNILSLLI